MALDDITPLVRANETQSVKRSLIFHHKQSGERHKTPSTERILESRRLSWGRIGEDNRKPPARHEDAPQ